MPCARLGFFKLFFLFFWSSFIPVERNQTIVTGNFSVTQQSLIFKVGAISCTPWSTEPLTGNPAVRELVLLSTQARKAAGRLDMPPHAQAVSHQSIDVLMLLFKASVDHQRCWEEARVCSPLLAAILIAERCCWGCACWTDPRTGLSTGQQF